MSRELVHIWITRRTPIGLLPNRRFGGDALSVGLSCENLFFETFGSRGYVKNRERSLVDGNFNGVPFDVKTVFGLHPTSGDFSVYFNFAQIMLNHLVVIFYNGGTDTECHWVEFSLYSPLERRDMVEARKAAEEDEDNWAEYLKIQAAGYMEKK